MGITLSHPAQQPQCDPSPRRAAVDTGSEGPGVSRFETPIEEEELLPLETSNYTSSEQEYILLQPDVGVTIRTR